MIATESGTKGRNVMDDKTKQAIWEKWLEEIGKKLDIKITMSLEAL